MGSKFLFKIVFWEKYTFRVVVVSLLSFFTFRNRRVVVLLERKIEVNLR